MRYWIHLASMSPKGIKRWLHVEGCRVSPGSSKTHFRTPYVHQLPIHRLEFESLRLISTNCIFVIFPLVTVRQRLELEWIKWLSPLILVLSFCFEPDVTDSAVLPCLSITEIHTVESAESQHSCCFALPGQQVQQNHEQIVRNCNKLNKWKKNRTWVWQLRFRWSQLWSRSFSIDLHPACAMKCASSLLEKWVTAPTCTGHDAWEPSYPKRFGTTMRLHQSYHKKGRRHLMIADPKMLAFSGPDSLQKARAVESAVFRIWGSR